MTEAHTEHEPSGHHGAKGHGTPFLAHHFDSPKQQFAAGKLGMWIFLLTEILLFGGFFCAYAVYRANHPELFQDGHHFLDRYLGALNTVVLITSSLTMALGVYCAQTNRRRTLVAMLAVTLLCGFVFMGVKFVEYRAKWVHGMVPGQQRIEWFFTFQWVRGNEPAPFRGFDPDVEYVRKHLETHGVKGLTDAQLRARAANLYPFFGCYFGMTALHGLHVLAGLGAIGWVMLRSLKGHFSNAYFGPVDFVGLYWHLVDLIWIFLFPLLYLIH
jgi:cytochrome c oxidase subunit 3